MRDDWRRVTGSSFDKRRQAGYYIWNYGERKTLTADEIRRGCKIYAELFYKDMIDEIIFCSTRYIAHSGKNCGKLVEKLDHELEVISDGALLI